MNAPRVEIIAINLPIVLILMDLTLVNVKMDLKAMEGNVAVSDDS